MGTPSTWIKVIYEKPTANNILNGKRLNASPSYWEQCKDVSFTTSIQHGTGDSSSVIKKKVGKQLNSDFFKDDTQDTQSVMLS